MFPGCDSKEDYIRDYENADTISIDTLALEDILQEERTREISELNLLSEKVCFLHTNILYYRNPKSKIGATCYDAWKTIVKKIGGSPNTWRELGYCLAIAQEDLDYIKNSVRDDPADIVLKVFMQNDTATLDKVVDALVKMKRYDILKAVEIPLYNLTQCFNKEDSGYHSSNSKNTGTREIISFTKNLQIDLPPALKRKYTNTGKGQKSNQPSLRLPEKSEKDKIKNNNPILFLTFTEDGLDTALNIQQYVDEWDSPRVTVLTLSADREVYQNPEKHIKEYFEKADFIVPIITPDYLDKIKSNAPEVPCTMNDNLDYKYVKFIYTLINNHYIYASGCLNHKVRSVLPQNANVDVREYSMFTDLLPWTYEEDFNDQFKAFLNTNLTDNFF